jgi:hypothetical protein
MMHMFTLRCFLFVYNLKGGTLYLSYACCCPHVWHNQHHCALSPPNLNFQLVGGVWFTPIKRYVFKFFEYVFKKNFFLKGQGKCQMHNL